MDSTHTCGTECACTACKKNSWIIAFVAHAKKWMQKAVKPENKGLMREYAKEHGGLLPNGNISISFLKSLIGNEKIPGIWRKRANFALRANEARH